MKVELLSYEHIRDILTYTRKFRGISISKLAEEMEVSSRAVRMWEKGERVATGNYLFLWCYSLGYQLSFLIDSYDQEKS